MSRVRAYLIHGRRLSGRSKESVTIERTEADKISLDWCRDGWIVHVYPMVTLEDYHAKSCERCDGDEA